MLQPLLMSKEAPENLDAHRSNTHVSQVVWSVRKSKQQSEHVLHAACGQQLFVPSDF